MVRGELIISLKSLFDKMRFSSIWTGSGEIISSEDWHFPVKTYETTSKAESCLGLTKVKDLTGLTCHKTMEWICEDSDGLLAEAGLI